MREKTEEKLQQLRQAAWQGSAGNWPDLNECNHETLKERLMELEREIKNEQHLLKVLVELSITEGGAWVFAVKPFSRTVTFVQFQNPSNVPDHFHDVTHNTMAHKGKLRGFTGAAQVREQNRGLGTR